MMAKHPALNQPPRQLTFSSPGASASDTICGLAASSSASRASDCCTARSSSLRGLSVRGTGQAGAPDTSGGSETLSCSLIPIFKLLGQVAATRIQGTRVWRLTPAPRPPRPSLPCRRHASSPARACQLPRGSSCGARKGHQEHSSTSCQGRQQVTAPSAQQALTPCRWHHGGQTGGPPCVGGWRLQHEGCRTLASQPKVVTPCPTLHAASVGAPPSQPDTQLT